MHKDLIKLERRHRALRLAATHLALEALQSADLGHDDPVLRGKANKVMLLVQTTRLLKRTAWLNELSRKRKLK